MLLLLALFQSRPVEKCREGFELPSYFLQSAYANITMCHSSAIPNHNQPSSDHLSSSTEADSIFSFLKRAAYQTADILPDCDEEHIPLYSKRDTYHIFVHLFALLNGNVKPPSLPFLLPLQLQHYSKVNVQKVQQFSKFSEFYHLHAAVRHAGTNNRLGARLRKKKRRLAFMVKLTLCLQYHRLMCTLVEDQSDRGNTAWQITQRRQITALCRAM